MTEPCMLFFPSCLRACSAPARGEAYGSVQDERYSSRYSECCAGSVCFAVPAAASLYAIRSSSADGLGPTTGATSSSTGIAAVDNCRTWIGKHQRLPAKLTGPWWFWTNVGERMRVACRRSCEID
jgi:hypothetical protein